MKITAVGDCAIQKCMPKYYQGFEEVRDIVARGDVRFFNLETTVCEDCFPGAHSGGTWLRTTRKVLDSIKDFGFNVTTSANNHCMDFSYDGFLQTLENIESAGYAQAGGGKNLAKASAPAYIDTPSGRAAIIACVTECDHCENAGEQTRDFLGRPGVNPLGIKKVVYVSKEELEQLKEIAKRTTLNVYNEIITAQGYKAPLGENEFEFCDTAFRVGEPRIEFELSERDMKRITTAIKDASMQADLVFISIHNHAMQGEKRTDVPKFLTEFAHRCIDAGAHGIIGHGPHLMQGVEIYKGLPIMYSLGDFMLQLENCEAVPDDFYKKFGLCAEDGLYEVFKKRTKDFTIGLQRQSEMMESVIASFEMENGKLTSLKFTPVELGLGQKHSSIGWPRKSENKNILKQLAELSKPFGTVIAEDGKVKL